MSDREKIIVLNAIIQRMRNLKEVQKITQEDPISCRMTEKEIKELIYLLEDYLFFVRKKVAEC